MATLGRAVNRVLLMKLVITGIFLVPIVAASVLQVQNPWPSELLKMYLFSLLHLISYLLF